MDAIIAFMSLLTIVTIVGMAAFQWGTDSRPTIGDDHAR